MRAEVASDGRTCCLVQRNGDTKLIGCVDDVLGRGPEELGVADFNGTRSPMGRLIHLDAKGRGDPLRWCSKVLKLLVYVSLDSPRADAFESGLGLSPCGSRAVAQRSPILGCPTPPTGRSQRLSHYRTPSGSVSCCLRRPCPVESTRSCSANPGWAHRLC